MSEVSQWMAKREPVPHVKNVFVLYLALNHEDQFSRFESFEFSNIAYYRIATVRELALRLCVESPDRYFRIQSRFWADHHSVHNQVPVFSTPR
jgi:hypothetical protein